MLDWITNTKIPVGDVAETIFDYIRDNADPVLDAISDGMEILIDAILWVLQTPNPLIVIAAFVALTW
ncbi:MAG: choline ABC transporter permease subunit, partial [Pseudomonadota bacterium]